MATVKNLNGLEVYQVGQFGQYAGAKAGQPCCWKKTITDSFNMSGNSYWVNQDSTGNTFRLVLNGVQFDYVAKRTPSGYELPKQISLTPVGELLS